MKVGDIVYFLRRNFKFDYYQLRKVKLLKKTSNLTYMVECIRKFIDVGSPHIDETGEQEIHTNFLYSQNHANCCMIIKDIFEELPNTRRNK